MSWTKRQIVSDAYAELALAGYVFDLSPEELAAALRRLDLMMAQWDGIGLRLGYPIDPEGSDLDQPAGIPLQAVEAVTLGLAVRLAAGKGKTLAAMTLINAKRAYDALLGQAMAPTGQQQFRGGVPRGAGSRGAPWRTNLPVPDTSPLGVADNGTLDFLGG